MVLPNAALIADELARARALRALKVADSHAPTTRLAYAADWTAFRAWCARAAIVEPERDAIPATDDTLSLRIGSRDHLAPTTLRRALAAVRLAHERAGFPMLDAEFPATVAALAGHARRHARRRDGKGPGGGARQATPATDERLRAMLDTLVGDALPTLRNRAVLLVGFDLGLRRSELVALDVEDLQRPRTRTDSYAVRIACAKTDQRGQGAHVALLARPGSAYCPVAALERWLAAAGIRTGALFVGLQRTRYQTEGTRQRLSDRAVARIVKQTAGAAGLPGDLSGHSLRRGLITTALDAGVPAHRVQQHVRHRSIDSTMRYAEVRDAISTHPGVGLLAHANDEAHDTIAAAPTPATSEAPIA